MLKSHFHNRQLFLQHLRPDLQFNDIPQLDQTLTYSNIASANMPIDMGRLQQKRIRMGEKINVKMD